MLREEVFDKLNEVFRDVFDDDSIEVNERTVASDIEEWDSIHHIALLAAIEDEFDIEFSLQQTASMSDVSMMVDYIIIELK